jgi:hypothetical protein
LVRPGSDTAPDEYDQEKEYDDRFMVAEIYNDTNPVHPPQRKDAGLPIAIVISGMILTIVILLVLVIGFAGSSFYIIN